MPLAPQECTEEEFLNAIKDHEMHIVHDDDIHRHLQCKKPNSMVCYFNITTWPGYLCISGDMGSYVFTRIRDMFEFFRPRDDKLYINKSYWAEKLEAFDRTSGYEKFSPELFEDSIKETFEECEFENEEQKKETWESIKLEILGRAYDGEYEAMRAALDYESPNGHRLFQHFWESNFRSYTYRYTWCLYAIVWTIMQYDKQKATNELPCQNTV